MKDNNYYNFKYTFVTGNSNARVSVFADNMDSALARARYALGNSTASLTVHKIKTTKNTP